MRDNQKYKVIKKSIIPIYNPQFPDLLYTSANFGIFLLGILGFLQIWIIRYAIEIYNINA